MHLSQQDRAMLAGELGPAPRMALSILVRMAGVYGARELMDISQAHIDSTIYIGDAGLEFAERLAEAGARVAVPTTLNVSGVDEHHWREWAVPAEWARKAHRQMIAYERMGCKPTWTCAPYQAEPPPAFGQQIAWGESNAIVFANAVLGARTERYPDLLDICAAITARVPAAGLHLTENRGGQLLLRLAGVPRRLQGARELLARVRPSGRRHRRRPHPRHRRAGGAARRGSAQGLRRGRQLVGLCGVVPPGRHHAGGADARGRVSGAAAGGVHRGRHRAAARRPARADHRRGGGARSRRAGQPAFLAARVRAGTIIAPARSSTGATRSRERWPPAAS